MALFGGSRRRQFEKLAHPLARPLYQTALHRSGEAAGVKGWVDQLDHGTSRADVVTGFAFSPENMSGLQPALDHGVFTIDPNAADVARLYYGLLQRAPDQGGLSTFTTLVENGAS